MKFPFTGYNVLESYLITQIIFKQEKGGVLSSKNKNQLKRIEVAKPCKCVILDS